MVGKPKPFHLDKRRQVTSTRNTDRRPRRQTDTSRRLTVTCGSDPVAGFRERLPSRRDRLIRPTGSSVFPVYRDGPVPGTLASHRKLVTRPNHNGGDEAPGQAGARRPGARPGCRGRSKDPGQGWPGPGRAVRLARPKS